MKKMIIFAFCFLVFNFLNALGTLRVESIKMLPETSMNIEVRDADGKYAPVLIVKTALKGLGFQNVSRPTLHAAEYLERDHYYKFYMNDNQRVIKITHSDYEPLEVRILADFGVNVKTQRVYEMTLTNVPEKENINVVIISDPPNANIYIDDEFLGHEKNYMISTGIHNIKLEMEGYKTISDIIKVSKSNMLFEYVFSIKNDALLKISTIPTGANVFLNNLKIGVSPILKRYTEGSYQLKITKNNYKPYFDTILIKKGININKEIKLVSIKEFDDSSKKKNITLTKSIIRSSILPGLGHYYIDNQLKKGMIITGIHVALCSGFIYYYSRSMNKYKQYKSSNYIEDINSNYIKANHLFKTSEIFIGLDIILWVYSIFDVSKITNKNL